MKKCWNILAALLEINRPHVRNSWIIISSFLFFLLVVLPVLSPFHFYSSSLPLSFPFPLTPTLFSFPFLPLFIFPCLYNWMLVVTVVLLFDTTTLSWCLIKMLLKVAVLPYQLPFFPILQLGEASRPEGQVLLRGPQHQNHHMAEAHSWVCAQLPAVAEPAQPAAGRYAPVQPALPLPGIPTFPWPSLIASFKCIWDDDTSLKRDELLHWANILQWIIWRPEITVSIHVLTWLTKPQSLCQIHN